MSPTHDLDTALRDVLDERLDAIVPPVGDLLHAVGSGRRLRRRRRLAAGAGGALLAVSAVVGGLALTGPSGSKPDETAVEPLGPMDFSQGLRAYGDSVRLHLGGRTVDASALEFLDTDAVATQQGVVYFKNGDLMLVGEDGKTSVLDQGDPTSEGFHPTAKADTGSLVAYALSKDDRVVLKVMDVDKGEVIATRELDCSDPCGGLVIDGIDSGAVFVRDDEGTSIWGYETDRDPALFFEPGTQVADVRNHTVLYSGPAPDGVFDSAWTLVPGAIDAQLTYDGKHVLSWSSRLKSIQPAGQPVNLDQGPLNGYGFWTIDTDGSVLVTDPGKEGFRVYDCEVPSGSCELLGPLDPQGGDPIFIGNDM